MHKKGYLTLLGLLLSAVVIAIVFYSASKVYFLNFSTEEEKDYLSSQGVDTSSHQSVLESTKRKLDDISEQLLDNQKQVDNLTLGIFE